MGKTPKQLDIIVDETLFDMPEVQALVHKGHTIRRLMGYGYDIILGPKASSLSVEDVKKNPKLLEIAIKRATDDKYPKKEKEPKGGVDDTKAQASASEAVAPEPASTPQPAPSKRKPRAKKSAVGQGGAGTDSKTADPGADKPADSTGGGK